MELYGTVKLVKLVKYTRNHLVVPLKDFLLGEYKETPEKYKQNGHEVVDENNKPKHKSWFDETASSIENDHDEIEENLDQSRSSVSFVTDELCRDADAS